MALRKILYVDDERINLELLKIHFTLDYEVITVESAIEGLKKLEEIHDIDLIISDLKMPEMNGIEFVGKVKKLYPKKICIMLTAYAETDIMIKIINEDLIFRYLLKPWQKTELNKAIVAAFQKFDDKD